MKIVLLLGAGKSATVLIKYLLEKAAEMDLKLIVADTNLTLINQKINGNPRGIALNLDIKNADERAKAIANADLTISLLPPHLHILVARDCLQFNKHLFTASYLDKEVEELEPAIRSKGLLFLYEMGLDPGIDHMSAIAILDKIKSKGGSIKSFVSHCGGLVAPQSDNNPWHYKISWNPANVVAAGKQGAIYKQHNTIQELTYENVFDQVRTVSIEKAGTLAWYPNRNSIPYISLYQLEEAETFIRTTLRHPDFISGWKKLIALGLTNELPLSYQKAKCPAEIVQQLLTANHQIGKFQHWVKEDALFEKQVKSLGLLSSSIQAKKEEYSPASLLQELLESQLGMNENDQDRVVMQHEITYLLQNQEYALVSSLVLDGKNAVETAMATTVGLPLAIATTLFLNNKIDLIGLQRPLSATLYQQVLPALEMEGVRFIEKEIKKQAS
ncbi:MAG: saccharopine dehydrogenase [Bacteroidetes bacterium]|nr:saccharopine dehydrogenase [Bacteroidota bacterium]